MQFFENLMAVAWWLQSWYLQMNEAMFNIGIRTKIKKSWERHRPILLQIPYFID
jgi:hypothetical protein